MTVFDRSWYGRVLVERVEGFASHEQWGRAYEEIDGFERTLAEEGTILVKFWLHISSEEQLKRFEARAEDPLKTWKLTDDDWRNREKRPEYEAAVEEMLERTDQPAGSLARGRGRVEALRAGRGDAASGSRKSKPECGARGRNRRPRPRTRSARPCLSITRSPIS